MTETKYFLGCPRGFHNERFVYASDEKEVVDELINHFDDGMTGSFEEITEDKAKRLLFRSNVEMGITDWIGRDAYDIPIYPTFEDYKKMMKEASKNWSQRAF